MPAAKLALPALPKRLLREMDVSTAADCDPAPSPASRHGKPKRTRTSAPKTRTGCFTCKIRHLKCDEAKPSCKACTSTGRKCDGYKPNAKLNNAVVKFPDQPRGTLASLFERRALDHFCNYSAPILSSYFDSHFWMNLVLQMSSANAAVRHAVVALDTLSERMNTKAVARSDSYRSVRQQHEDWRNDRFAIVQYNKAIEHLTKDKESTTSADVIMVVCVLFICIEALRGDIESAFMHFNGGMKTAMAEMSYSSVTTGSGPFKRMEQDILQSLCRVELLSTLFDNYPQWPYPLGLSEVIPCEFHDVKAARDSLIHIMNLTMRFIRQVSTRRHAGCLTNQDHTRRAELQQALSDWSTKLHSTMAKLPASQMHVASAQVLRMHHLVTYIMLSKNAKRHEAAADRLLPEFEKALDLATELNLRVQQQASMRTSTFILEMEIVSPTYFIASKCRHPEVRRRAIALLKTMRRREGFFDSDLAAALATRLMSTEEAHLTVFDGSEWPGEETRIHRTDIKAAFDADGTKYTTIFYLKPNGVDGPWKILEEEIDAR